MKRLKTIIIKGECFTLKNEVKKLSDIDKLEFKRLNQCYAKPSVAKENIYNYWKSLLPIGLVFYEEDEKFGIKSYNSNIFTLHSLIRFNDKWYYACITKSNNYLYEVAE